MMKKLLSVLLAIAMVACVVAGFAGCSKSNGGDAESSSSSSESTSAKTVADLDKVKDANKLVIGITDYEPIDYKDKDGKWIGFDADLARAVAEKMGIDVEFVVINWDNKFIELNSGSIDCIWNGMTVSDSVKTNCDISDAYAGNSQVVVMKEDALSKYADADAIKAADLTIAVEKGSAGETEAKKLSSNVVSLSAQSDALKEVKSGTADACIIDSTMANSMTKDGTDFANLGYSVSLTTEEYAVGFRKGSDLTAEVNRLLAELKEDGTMDKLSAQYGVDLAK
ncbi:MAG: transporter substrate-binding domain-containing protein [Eubacteriales bacterium]|nr:transporter substrate-binding domain-containing protein [Eubacteriales bacterium]